MSEETLPADRQHLVYARFNENLRRQLRTLVTEDLIEEHRRKPLGQHTDVLERLLNFFRRPPRYGLYSRRACREFQLIALPVVAGQPPLPLDATVYTDEDAALHAVFMKHVEDLMRD